MCELAGYQEANERARALLAEHKAKLAEAREFLADRQEAIQGLQTQLTQKDAQASADCDSWCPVGEPSSRAAIRAGDNSGRLYTCRTRAIAV